jgi:hypothetical protein
MSQEKAISKRINSRKSKRKFGSYALFLSVANECGFYKVLQKIFPNNHGLIFSFAQFFVTHSLNQNEEFISYNKTHYSGYPKLTTLDKIKVELGLTIRGPVIQDFNELWIKTERSLLKLADKNMGVVICLTEDFYLNNIGKKFQLTSWEGYNPTFYYLPFLSHASLVPLAFYLAAVSPFYEETIRDCNRYCHSMKLPRPLYAVYHPENYNRILFAMLNKNRCLYLDNDPYFEPVKRRLVKGFLDSKRRAETILWLSDIFPRKIIRHSFRVVGYRYLSDFLRVCKEKKINPEWNELSQTDLELKAKENQIKKELLACSDLYYHLIVTTDQKLPVDTLIRDQAIFSNYVTSYREKADSTTPDQSYFEIQKHEIIEHFLFFLGMILKQETINYLKPLFRSDQNDEESLAKVLSIFDSFEIEQADNHWVKSEPLTEAQKDILRELLVNEDEIDRLIANL